MLSKHVFITGIHGGIGKAIGKLFRANGWKVIGVDICEEAGAECDVFYAGDVGNVQTALDIKEDLLVKGIAIDSLVNNAGVQYIGTLVETPEAEWLKVMNTNVNALFYLSKHLYGLLKGGTIINISSVHAKATSIGLAAYVASKGAVSALTRAMALEMAKDKIRVNAILPGAIETEMLIDGLKRNDDSQKALDSLVGKTPLKRLGKPEDIARIAYFLADNTQSGNITGQEFVCDGGVLSQLASE